MSSLQPNFQLAYNKAIELLISSCKINSFPFDIKDLISECMPEIRCRSFAKALEYGLGINDFGSNSSIIFEYPNKKSLIFYNQDSSQSRITSNISHELGHHTLGHNLNGNVSIHLMTENQKEIYGIKEIEANYFMASLLMPDIIIKVFQKRGKRIDIDFLVETFGVSTEAAKKRLDFLNGNFYKFFTYEKEQQYEDILLEKFNSWIESKMPQSYNKFWEDFDEKEFERNNWLY